MFNLNAFARSSLGRLTGQTNVLEAYLAGGIGVAASDGSISRAELDAVLTGAIGDSFVTKLFDESAIRRTMDQLVQKIRAGGKAVIEKELIDIAGGAEEVRHAVYLCIYKTAKSDGVLKPAEQAACDRYAALLNITAEDKAAIEAGADSNDIKFDF